MLQETLGFTKAIFSIAKAEGSSSNTIKPDGIEIFHQIIDYILWSRPSSCLMAQDILYHILILQILIIHN